MELNTHLGQEMQQDLEELRLWLLQPSSWNPGCQHHWQELQQCLRAFPRTKLLSTRSWGFTFVLPVWNWLLKEMVDSGKCSSGFGYMDTITRNAYGRNEQVNGRTMFLQAFLYLPQLHSVQEVFSNYFLQTRKWVGQPTWLFHYILMTNLWHNYNFYYHYKDEAKRAQIIK